MRTEKARPGARPEAGDEQTDEQRSEARVADASDKRRVHWVGKRGKTTLWGQVYGELLAAEKNHRGYTPEQHRANVEHRVRQAVAMRDTEHTRNQERRNRVLRHPDLADRLKAALRLSEPSRWNGWVPPRTLPELACRVCAGDRRVSCRREHVRAANTSWIRAELVAIAAEAKRREAGEHE